MSFDYESLQRADALNFMGLCLAQPGKPHLELGFRSQNEAFDVIATRFSSKPNTVKNNRDSFDRYTESDRVGWEGPLRPALKKIWDISADLSSSEIIKIGKSLLEKDWEQSNPDDGPTLDIKLTNRFKIPDFAAVVDSSDLAWGFKNKTGYEFKITTSDLIIAFECILDSWQEWANRDLNRNNMNPDVKLKDFVDKYFKEGAAQALANVQRRGFLHLISAIAYISSNDGLFDSTASAKTLPRQYYEEALSQLKKIESLADGKAVAFSTAVSSLTELKTAENGRNIIYYGAPGTGKSHLVDKRVGKGGVVRTVFHPDTQNSDFFGSLKPRMDEQKVVYRFAPGPFSRVLSAAIVDPAHQYFLVIEELNRAPAAAVFGELFQLLDREEDGLGKYEVDYPNDESAEWFFSQGVEAERLRIPSNLTIYATMNSADQGVYPLDTAFRRRWEQEYLPLDGGDAPSGVLSIIGKSHSLTINWPQFAKVLNEHRLAWHVDCP